MNASSRFSKIIGKGNPAAVLATMILLSYAKFFDVILGSIYLLYFRPAYGSRKVDLTTIKLRIVKVGNGHPARVCGFGGLEWNGRMQFVIKFCGCDHRYCIRWHVDRKRFRKLLSRVKQ